MERAHAGERYTLHLESVTVTSGCMSESGVYAVILYGVCAVFLLAPMTPGSRQSIL